MFTPERLWPLLCGVGLGLYASRVLAESGSRAWPLIQLLPLVAVCAFVGVILVAWAGRFLPRYQPLGWLWVYVLWPWASGPVALGCLAVTLLSLLMLNGRPARRRLVLQPHLANQQQNLTAKTPRTQRKDYIKNLGVLRALAVRFVLTDWQADTVVVLIGWLPELALFLGALALYVHTLAPSVLPADSGEFQIVSVLLGIAHPPGYALYTLLGKLATLLPLGDAAYRVNLLSALLAAGTLVGLYRLVRLVTRSGWAGMAAALALGATPTFWAQATTANIRALTAFFTVWPLYFVLLYGVTRERRALLAFAFSFGLGISHHASLAFLALPMAAYLLLADPTLLRRWREWSRALAAFGSAFLVWLYLPLRSLMGAPFDAAPIRSVQGFLDHVLARGFGGDMFAFATPDVLADRLPVLGNILVMQFGYPLLLLALLGLGWALWRERRLALLLGGAFLVNAFVAITYRAPQTVEYLLPAYVALAGLLGLGIGMLAAIRWPLLASALLALSLVAGATNLTRRYPSYRTLAQDRSPREAAQTLLEAAPANALLLANWHEATPLWYLQLVEGLRRDIEVTYVYPEGATPNGEVWARRIAEQVASRPVLVTNRYAEFDALPYRFLPFQRAELVLAGSLGTLPAASEGCTMTPLDVAFEGTIRLAGYALSRTTGGDVILHLAWQPLRAWERDYSFFVHLVSPAGGAPLAQGDRAHSAGRYQVGELLVDEYRLPVLPTTAAGRYTLLAGVYFTLPQGGWQRLRAPDGRDAVPLAEVEVAVRTEPPVTAHPFQAPFAGGLRAVGVDYDTSLPGQLRVYLHCYRPQGEAGSYLVQLRRGQETIQAALPAASGYSTLALDLPAGAGVLTLELLRPEGGAVPVALGPWHIPLQGGVRLPAPEPGERHLVLGGEMALKQAEWRIADGEARVTLRFLSLRPLTRDESVSVSAFATDGRRLAQHDTTPALGAIPTLKWIRGTVVEDLHLLALPADASGEASLRLAVYDAFTLQPLIVSDERFSRLGQGTQVELGKVQVR